MPCTLGTPLTDTFPTLSELHIHWDVEGAEFQLVGTIGQRRVPTMMTAAAFFTAYQGETGTPKQRAWKIFVAQISNTASSIT